VLLSRIAQLPGQRVGQSETMVGFPQQHHSGIRGQTIVAPLDLDRPIERGLKEGLLPFTHGMNLLA
jgi:hypothetical protein